MKVFSTKFIKMIYIIHFVLSFSESNTEVIFLDKEIESPTLK
jgi:hypothetical protein